MNDRILIQQHSTNPDDPQGTERRLALLQRNKELAEHFASQHRGEDVCVLVFDATQTPAADLPSAAVVDLIQEIRDEGNIPAVVIGMDRWAAYKWLRSYQRELHKRDKGDPKESPIVEKLQAPAPKGQFFYMVISRGKQLIQLSIPE